MLRHLTKFNSRKTPSQSLYQDPVQINWIIVILTATTVIMAATTVIMAATTVIPAETTVIPILRRKERNLGMVKTTPPRIPSRSSAEGLVPE